MTIEATRLTLEEARELHKKDYREAEYYNKDAAQKLCLSLDNARTIEEAAQYIQADIEACQEVNDSRSKNRIALYTQSLEMLKIPAYRLPCGCFAFASNSQWSPVYNHLDRFWCQQQKNNMKNWNKAARIVERTGREVDHKILESTANHYFNHFSKHFEED